MSSSKDIRVGRMTAEVSSSNYYPKKNVIVNENKGKNKLKSLIAFLRSKVMKI